jgi:hypothetical protein
LGTGKSSRNAARSGDIPRIDPVSKAHPGPDHTFAFPFRIAGSGSAAEASAGILQFRA